MLNPNDFSHSRNFSFDRAFWPLELSKFRPPRLRQVDEVVDRETSVPKRSDW